MDEDILYIDFIAPRFIPRDTSKVIIKKDFDVELVNKVIKILKEKNINAKIECKLPYKSVGLDNLNKIQDKSMVYFKAEEKEYTVEQLIETEQILDTFVKDIKESNMSPYEKYVAIYLIVTNFKSYKEYNGESPIFSRSIYTILKDEYIVCSGYTELLCELLKRVGINAEKVCVIVTKDKIPHSRAMVYIDDPKYNIKGVIFNDPTYDVESYSEQDFYKLKYHINMDLNELWEDTTDAKLLNDEKIKECNKLELYCIKNIYETLLKKIFEIKNEDRESRKKFYIDKDDNSSYISKIKEYIFDNTAHIKKEDQCKAMIEVKQFILDKEYGFHEYYDEMEKIENSNERINIEEQIQSGFGKSILFGNADGVFDINYLKMMKSTKEKLSNNKK